MQLKRGQSIICMVDTAGLFLAQNCKTPNNLYIDTIQDWIVFNMNKETKKKIKTQFIKVCGGNQDIDPSTMLKYMQCNGIPADIKFMESLGFKVTKLKSDTYQVEP